jgi:hypothetical protein
MDFELEPLRTRSTGSSTEMAIVKVTKEMAEAALRDID